MSNFCENDNSEFDRSDPTSLSPLPFQGSGVIGKHKNLIELPIQLKNKREHPVNHTWTQLVTGILKNKQKKT